MPAPQQRNAGIAQGRVTQRSYRKPPVAQFVDDRAHRQDRNALPPQCESGKPENGITQKRRIKVDIRILAHDTVDHIANAIAAVGRNGERLTRQIGQGKWPLRQRHTRCEHRI